MDFVRKIVSKQKKRFEWGNFDLDLTYITDRIIAMGFPSESIEGLYRNNMKDVQRFFNTLHPDHFKIYNLCSERKYDHEKFGGNVGEFPFDDHNPPTLDMIAKFCEDVEEWLDRHPENIVGIHCKAGKGRTGTVIACWLMYNKHCSTSSESMRLFGTKRTHNGKGVTIPSQARYVRYFEALLNYGKPIRYAPTVTKILSTIHMNALPDFNIGGGCEPYLCIVQQDKSVFYTKPLKLKKGTKQVEIDCGNIILSNDVKIRFYNKNSKGYMFSYCFHTAFIDSSRICIRRVEIDKAHKDTKHFPSNFSIELHFCEDLLEEDLIDIGFKEDSTTNNNNNNSNTISIHNHSNNNSNSLISNNNQLYGTSFINNLDKLFTTNNSNSNDNISNNSNSNSNISYNNNKDEEINSNNRSRAISSKEVFKCPKCQLNILFTEVSVNDGLNNYHWKCLTCNQCNKSLIGDNNCLFQGNGKSLCIDCGTQSGFFKFCSGCNLVIKTSNFEEFGDLIFHKSCFLCCTCLCYLVGKDFIIKEGKSLECSTCIENNNKIIIEETENKNNNNFDEINIKENSDKTFEGKINMEFEPSIPLVVEPIESIESIKPVELIESIETIVPINLYVEPIEPITLKVEPIIELKQEQTLNGSREEFTKSLGIICTKCNISIGLRPIIIETGVYHKDCFICNDCSIPLEFTNYCINDQSNKPICQKCEKILMKNNKDELFKEDQQIITDDSSDDSDDSTTDEDYNDNLSKLLELNNSNSSNSNNMFKSNSNIHLSNSNFVSCFGCKKIIEDEEMMDALGEKWHTECLVCVTCKKQIEGAFGDHQGLIYCRDHYADIVGIKCNFCNQIIDSIFVKFNGKKLHPNCFLCFNCNKTLQDGKYYEKNGNIICELCRSVDIIKRRTQLQLQQSFIGVKRGTLTKESIDSNNSNNTLDNSNNNNNNNNLETTLNDSSSLPIQSFMSRTNSSFRQSTRVNISDFKFTSSTISQRRGLTFYPSLHRKMPLRFKVAYPSQTTTPSKPRKDFLSLNKSIPTNTI